VWKAIRPWLFPVWCIGCGVSETGLCPDCAGAARAPETIVLGGLIVRSAAEYGGVVRDAILSLKRGERACLDPLAALLAPLVPAAAVLVPVPTTRRRAAERGFDQARELARRAAALRSGACAELLRKHGAPQHLREREARLAARGRFRLRAGDRLPAAAVLLDDVVTTGATLRDAAATLTAAGCRVDGAVVVARTPPGRETSGRAGRLVGA
jgi:predicted amidophosphoribosyltransferase